MPGINTSMFYVGSAGSFTELHVEDSIADSANIIHAGKVKIWMIVAREYYVRLNCIIAQIMKNVQPDRKGKGEENREICELPLHHKNLVLTPRFLDEHEIRYEFIVQNAGDLVNVRYGILHQVLNVGLNVAEAINVGSDGWNFANELKILCRCESCTLVHAATNTDVDMAVNFGKPKARTHQCDTCTRMFGTKQLLAKHRKEVHKVTHICSICNGQYQHVQSLNRHI